MSQQLPPVQDESLALTAPCGKSQSAQFGRAAYEYSFNRFFVLDTPVRQNQGPLLQACTNLRAGIYSATDAAWLADRRLAVVAPPTASVAVRNEWALGSPDLMVASCFNRDRNTWNSDYLQTFTRVCILKAQFTSGTSHVKAVDSQGLGAAKAIALTSYVGVGVMVKLTTNLCPGTHIDTACYCFSNRCFNFLYC